MSQIPFPVAAAVLILTLFPHVGQAEGEKFTVKEVPLTVQHKYVHYDTFLPDHVDTIVVTPEYAVFVASRTVWIKQRNNQPVPLSNLIELPRGFDWYAGAYAMGDKLLISVGNYSEERRQKDLATGRGGYIEGPKPAGLLVVQFKPAKATLVSSVKVAKRQLQPDGQPEPDTIVPKFQSCFYDGKGLYLGEYGYLARVDLDSRSADLIELDEMTISRLAIWKEDSTLWYAADEGGMDGSWISKLDVSARPPRSLMSYAIMNDGFTLPDSIFRYKGRLLTSSLAGVVEIDEGKKAFTQYQLTKDPKTMRVYKLKVMQDALWGLREDGWVRFDLDSRKAIHYHLQGDQLLNDIYSIGLFDGQMYIGTKTQVVKVRSK